MCLMSACDRFQIFALVTTYRVRNTHTHTLSLSLPVTRTHHVHTPVKASQGGSTQNPISFVVGSKADIPHVLLRSPIVMTSITTFIRPQCSASGTVSHRFCCAAGMLIICLYQCVCVWCGVCTWERERGKVCVWEREREREWVCVYVRACLHQCACIFCVCVWTRAHELCVCGLNFYSSSSCLWRETNSII